MKTLDIKVTDIPGIEPGPDYPRRIAEIARESAAEEGPVPPVDAFEVAARAWVLVSAMVPHSLGGSVPLEMLLLFIAAEVEKARRPEHGARLTVDGDDFSVAMTLHQETEQLSSALRYRISFSVAMTLHQETEQLSSALRYRISEEMGQFVTRLLQVIEDDRTQGDV